MVHCAILSFLCALYRVGKCLGPWNLDLDKPTSDLGSSTENLSDPREVT